MNTPQMSLVVEDTSSQDEPSVEEFLGVTRPPAWRRTMKFWLPAIAGIFALIALVLWLNSNTDEQYVTEAVVEESLDLTVTATGNLRPINQVTVGAEVTGPVDEVLVDVNDRVTQGQVIAIINTEITDQQIAQSRANLNAAKASYVQAQAALDATKAQLVRFREVRELSGGRVPSLIELEQAEAAAARDKAAVASAQANIEAAEATLGANLTTRSRAVIRAPVTGVVLARQIEVGQTVVAAFNTVTLFVIAEDLSAMQLRVSIDEADVGQVESGQKVVFTVDAYPGRTFPATVERIDLASANTVAEQTNPASSASRGTVVSYEARLKVRNPDGLLRPGMTASASIATQSTGKVLLVPNAALRFSPEPEEEAESSMVKPDVDRGDDQQQAGIGIGSRQQVHVQQADGSLRIIEVVTGRSDGRRTAVQSDELEAGMLVVTGIEAQG
ncbi:MAG: efflux RND transporter periplasmic adaptor subunit [Pseudomonadota bacterium]